MTPAALAAVVSRAAEAVDGVQVRRRGRRRVEIDIADGSSRVRMELTARYGLVLPTIASKVQERVAAALGAMCRVEVDAVDVSVEEAQ